MAFMGILIVLGAFCGLVFGALGWGAAAVVLASVGKRTAAIVCGAIGGGCLLILLGAALWAWLWNGGRS